MSELSVYESKKLGGDKCWYCGDDVLSFSKTADHFYPKSMGGRLKVVCCDNCNRMKRDKIPSEFINLIESLKKKHPRFQKRFDRMILATQTLWERVKWSI